MTAHGKDWLTARAHEGNPATDVYNLSEAYPGERDDLITELQTALKGCDDPQADRLGSAMLAAIRLNSLPVLRATVAVWRDAYLGLLAQITEPPATTNQAALAPEEIERLATLKRRLTAGALEDS